MGFVIQKVKVTVEKLKELMLAGQLRLDGFEIAAGDDGSQPPQEGWREFNNERLKGKDLNIWLRAKIKTPPKQDGKAVYFSLKTGREGQWDAVNPQCLVYLDGTATQGLDVNHTDVQLESGREYRLTLNLNTGMADGEFDFIPSLKIIDRRIEKLYYDLQIPYDACTVLKEDDINRINILKELEIALSYLDLRKPYSEEFYDSVEKTSAYLEENFYGRLCSPDKTAVACIGHTHIDVAWLWRLKETRQKAQRSFATMLELMRRYPEYKFMSSQAQLYLYVKETQPRLFEEIKKRVAEGRWEVEGAMWVEADCNLTSGESLIRQILFGKRFFKKEFGVDSKILWLPDVFGYSAALPQILKKSGVEKFVTSKISWSETNKMPYDTFIWEGIDGTGIFTYFITARSTKWPDGSDNYTTYNGDIDAGYVAGTYQRNQQKEYNDETIITFGYGDGGGGPTREMLERQRRFSRGLPGLPKTEIKSVAEFLEGVENRFYENGKKLKRLPKWCDELYLELHRGTYTSVAEIKKNNRKGEALAAKAELLSSICRALKGRPYPQNEINDMWRTLLLNQFHDIIPGSSIYEVYEDSRKQFELLRKRGDAIVEEKLDFIAGSINTGGGLLVFNPNPFEADGFVEYDGKTVAAKSVPPLGWTVIKPESADSGIKASEELLENEYIKITFDGKGNILSIYDKENDRQVIKEGGCANELIVFEDLPKDWDAWDITDYYKQKWWKVPDADNVKVISKGASASVFVTRRYLNSAIEQEICLCQGSRRIDFKTRIDWHEEHQMLKAFFPINVRSNKVTYEIQYGNIERANHFNTSWDAAKFEVCAHKWADISDGSYGVSLLNDCKYGHSAEGSTLALTLLRCPTYPNPDADKGEHTFVYSLLPHSGDYRAGGTVKEAYLLNRPLCAKYVEAGSGELKETYSFIQCDKENIFIETVKKAEDGDALIVRLYDAYDICGKCRLTFGFDVKKAYICDMMENERQQLEVSGNTVTLPVKNFEIVSLKIFD
jgi:alpha-mannosidase